MGDQENDCRENIGLRLVFPFGFPAKAGTHWSAA
jgi:hypothetical protein